MTPASTIRAVRSILVRSGTVMLVAAASVVGVLVATAALASSSGGGNGHRARARTDIAVLSRRPQGSVHAARGDSLKPPPGAILAAVVGRVSIYVWRNPRHEDCVIDLHVGAEVGLVTCAPSATAERRGMVQVSREARGATAPGSPATVRVSTLVPDGVTSITVTDRDGSSHETRVSNNVAVREDIRAASVSYTLPGGSVRKTNVAAIVDRTPHRPAADDPRRARSR
jgi:hypothetical protein